MPAGPAVPDPAPVVAPTLVIAPIIEEIVPPASPAHSRDSESTESLQPAYLPPLDTGSTSSQEFESMDTDTSPSITIRSHDSPPRRTYRKLTHPSAPSSSRAAAQISSSETDSSFTLRTKQIRAHDAPSPPSLSAIPSPDRPPRRAELLEMIQTLQEQVAQLTATMAHQTQEINSLRTEIEALKPADPESSDSDSDDDNDDGGDEGNGENDNEEEGEGENDDNNSCNDEPNDEESNGNDENDNNDNDHEGSGSSSSSDGPGGDKNESDLILPSGGERLSIPPPITPAESPRSQDTPADESLPPISLIMPPTPTPLSIIHPDDTEYIRSRIIHGLHTTDDEFEQILEGSQEAAHINVDEIFLLPGLEPVHYTTNTGNLPEAAINEALRSTYNPPEPSTSTTTATTTAGSTPSSSRAPPPPLYKSSYQINHHCT